MGRKKIERIKEDVQPEVRYNFFRADENSRYLEWLFLIVDTPKEINRISNRIYDILAPIEDEGMTYEGATRTEGYNYRMIDFKSTRDSGSAQPSLIMKFSGIRKDDNLKMEI